MGSGVRQIALAALPDIAEPELEALLQAFSLPRLRAQFAALALCDAQAADATVAGLYFGGKCGLSPNDYFDEAWYLDHYADVRQALGTPVAFSGFVHFVRRGFAEQRWPNAVLCAASEACPAPAPAQSQLDGDAYLAQQPEAANFLRAFPFVSPLEHYNAYGRRLGYRAGASAGQLDASRVVQSGFDPVFYARTYLDGDATPDAALEHYVLFGMSRGHAPNAWFDETWYRAFNPDVRKAIAGGLVPCGYYHYLVSGRAEERAPRHELAAALEARLPGVTRPALLQRMAELQSRLDPQRPLPAVAPAEPRRRRVWLFLPTINPDIMFGGYRAALWLIEGLARCGYEPAIVCLHEAPNPAYLLFHERSKPLRAALAEIRVLSGDDFAEASIGPEDRFVAYSVWDLPICVRLAERAGAARAILLAQEYEPVFYDHGGQRAICEELYALPHVAIFNSALLEQYFRANRLGVFRAEATDDGLTHATFEHRITALSRQTVAALRERSTRHLVLYARPEAHAARNLFEVAVLALKRLCQSGTFAPHWRFEGVGALSELPPVPLGGGHELRLRQKMSEAEYVATMNHMDIGISLMFAPHPSVVPFEFATTGALVVTNTFQNRTAEQLRAICANIVPCDAGVAAVAAAITAALARVEDAAARVAQALRPDPATWSATFSAEFLRPIFGDPHPAPSRRAPLRRVAAPDARPAKVA